ncbi:hypothetical protein ACQKM9_17160 [Viridibacillus sp. NPDC093762]|uniref:hypothetical protein n=1 Tax=Viridibacillus sp. NPDC093762 TaxID=3390720 RepID=UPI003D023856
MGNYRVNEGDINVIVARNVKNYIDAVGKSQKWVYERSGIPKATFYNLIKGEGDINKSIPKLNKLFRIQDPFYFYNENIQLPRTLEELEADSIKNFSAASFNGTDSEAFRETMTILDEIINMIHTLKSAKELG